MAISVHTKAFLEYYSFIIPGDKEEVKHEKKELTLKDRIIYSLAFGLLISLPLLNTLMGISSLRNLKKNGIEDEDDKAKLGLAIVMTTGLSILLLPVLVIGTIARAIFNAAQKEEKNKLYRTI